MAQIARRILQYKKEKGASLYGPGFEAEIKLLDDIHRITLTYVTEAQQQWKKYEVANPSIISAS
jgi:hypothetical protein